MPRNGPGRRGSRSCPGTTRSSSVVGDLLRQLPQAGLPDQDCEDTEAAAQEVLAEITGPDAPEPRRLRRALNGLKGALAPVATGLG
ncbi:hypothetical protein [Streptomyces viridochromogenes]|uniref:Uncharacterized protein n=1 Tax=Streptomyces viridochromogenes Tue57 TaxID=1160705 RepID=L8PK47_STRVR|nr:hypothetical protein [Streptomyces viridochromogenes]ELS57916.1 hypothetical protein STVIR_1159 [Streptomyces viridochromogenes Tue57]